ncbi:SLC13 family permease [Bifidobacterium aquikefiricola]|uniref:ArsB/NhaD family transporter n=1 Tax=Bifidobacterium aquikefiricola TaxID=3059038 RepID=A0AB39U830_9BIFI
MIHLEYLAITALLLGVMLYITVTAKNGWVEGVVGIVGSGLLLAIHATSYSVAVSNITQILPTVLFLGCCLTFARLCEKERLFEYLGYAVGKLCREKPRLLFLFVFALCAIVTTVLSLDATILLLTPIVLQAASRLRLDHRPFSYVTVHLANTASMLLPVSNLTNLLLIAYGNMGFMTFIRLSWLPWLIALLVEFLSLFVMFHASLHKSRPSQTQPVNGQSPDQTFTHPPVFAMVAVVLTLIGFVITGMLDIPPYWVALSGCIALVLKRSLSKKSTLSEELRTSWKSFNLSFLIFVLSLSVVVAALSNNGVNTLLLPIFHRPVTLLTLLLVAAVSVLACNVLNNLPAAMLLIPLAASHSPVMAMAVLIGVNIGPNLTYIGSLANILWRRILIRTGKKVELLQFTWIGLVSTSLCIIAAITALWLSSTAFSL